MGHRRLNSGYTRSGTQCSGRGKIKLHVMLNGDPPLRRSVVVEEKKPVTETETDYGTEFDFLRGKGKRLRQ